MLVYHRNAAEINDKTIIVLSNSTNGRVVATAIALELMVRWNDGATV